MNHDSVVIVVGQTVSSFCFWNAICRSTPRSQFSFRWPTHPSSIQTCQLVHGVCMTSFQTLGLCKDSQGANNIPTQLINKYIVVSVMCQKSLFKQYYLSLQELLLELCSEKNLINVLQICMCALEWLVSCNIQKVTTHHLLSHISYKPPFDVA